MRRRRLLTAVAGGLLAETAQGARTDDAIPQIEFYSTASLVDATGSALTGDSRAGGEDGDRVGLGRQRGRVLYPEDTPIPVAARDGTVAGFGSILTADDDVNFEYGNEEFLVNAIDDLGGPGTRATTGTGRSRGRRAPRGIWNRTATRCSR